MSEPHYPLIVRPRFIVDARKFWRQCHLVLALGLGSLFALIGLTGSLSVYREELDSLFNPHLRIEIPQDGAPLPPDKILVSLRKAHPDRHGAWTLEMPLTPDRPLTAWFDKPKESVDAYYSPLMVSINPYTGAVLDSRLWGQTFSTWILDLHAQLQLEATGRYLAAILGGLLILSTVSGLYLWWPGWRNLAGAFHVRRDGSLIRLIFDFHRWLGLAAAGFLLLLAFTGLHLAYPPLLESLTSAEGMGHGDAGPNVRSTAVPNDRPVTAAEAILVARGPFPSSEVRRVTTPAGELGVYRVNLCQRDEINQHHPFTTVWVDRWSGQIRDVRNPHRFSPGQTVTVWLWPLHTGEAFGAVGRFLWFCAGLAPTLLFVSGLLHWLYRHGWIADRQVDWVELTDNIRSKTAGSARRIGAAWTARLPRMQTWIDKAAREILNQLRR